MAALVLAAGLVGLTAVAVPDAGAGARTAPAAVTTAAPTAPAAPAPTSATTPATDGSDAWASAPTSSGDPLAANGFGSVLCREPATERLLSASAQGNCATSGFVAAAAPTGDYAFDVHLDLGVDPFSGPDLSMLIQDLVLTPVWTALLWIVHALLVAIEWCYSLDLLNATTLGSIATTLRAVQETLTQPLIALALTFASLVAAYDGLVRRRVAQSISDALLMLAMMAAGLWLVLDPIGTVGTVSEWGDQASLGALAAVADGAPQDAARALADGTERLFAAMIGGPWCFLEFGDVDWCRDPGELDPSLRAAGRQIEASEREAGTPAGDVSAELLARARSNGDLFLALPANGPERNSINEAGSLLRVLCGTTDATSCRGPTATEAEFRTESGTLSRAGGLLLITIGVAGMIAVLTFVVLRLLGAAVASIIYLLLAPFAVLAPALGERGRSTFRTWAARLLGALASKLVYSVVLGVLLLVVEILNSLTALGWWAQWLLITCLWWTAFQKRHQLLEFVAAPRDSSAHVTRFRVRTPNVASYGREVRRMARDHLRDRPHRPPPDVPPERRPPKPPRPSGPDPAARSPEDRPGGRPPASAANRGPVRAAEARAKPAVGRTSPDARLAVLRGEHEAAVRTGDRRRAASLAQRAERLAAERTPPSLPICGGRDRDALLDRQARLPAARERIRTGTTRRDYALLATAAGLPPGVYERLGPRERRTTRLALDRELDRRREALATGAPTGASFAPALPAPSARDGFDGGGHGDAGPPARPRPRRSAAAESPVIRRERQFAEARARAADPPRAPDRPKAHR